MHYNSAFSDFRKMVANKDVQICTSIQTQVTDVVYASMNTPIVALNVGMTLPHSTELVHGEKLDKFDNSTLRGDNKR